MQKIIVDYGVQKKLAKDVGCSTRSVQSALRFVTEGEQPDLIRVKAIRDYNGLLIKKPSRFNMKKHTL